MSSSLNVSLLDAPIDVPTIIDDTRLEPPPYQSPPMYINTFSLAENSSTHGMMSASHLADPFDTTASFTGYPSTALPDLGAIAKQPPPHPKPMTNQLDALVMNTMASLSPRSSFKNLSTLVSAEAKTNSSSNWSSASSLHKSPVNISSSDMLNASPQIDADSSATDLSDSLRVNLSALSLDDSSSSSSSVNSSRNATKKLDKAFYADLEKEIYKNELSAAALMANTSQTYARSSASKDSSVSMMPIEIYERRQPAEPINLSKVQNGSLPRLPPPPSSSSVTSSDKYAMTKSINQEIAAATRSNYETAPYHHIQKQNNTDGGGAGSSATTSANNDPTNAILTQIWFDQQESPQRKPTVEKNHSFVAISNRPTTNIYNSVAGDVYGNGSVLYETIGAPPPPPPLTYVGRPAVYGNTIPTMAPVLYDEVAGEDLLRPHRPAPVVPGLSAQQIQRRMEREWQQQQQIYGNVPETQKVAALMRELGDDEATQAEAMQALAAVNWDHAAGVRQFKIERLLR